MDKQYTAIDNLPMESAMTELAKTNKADNHSVWHWVYLVGVYPFVAAIVGLIKYAYYLLWLVIVAPLYLANYWIEKHNAGMWGVIPAIFFYIFMYFVGLEAWDEGTSLWRSWEMFPDWPGFENSIEAIIRISGAYVFYWILACIFAAIFSVFDWIGKNFYVVK